MWVVIVGIVPLIWHYVHLRLAQENIDVVFSVGKLFYSSLLGILFYFLIFGPLYLYWWGYLLGIPVSFMLGNILFDLITLYYIKNEKIKEEKGYGAAFRDAYGLCGLGIVLIILAIIVNSLV